MTKPSNSVIDLIGNTPCVKIRNLGPEHVSLYVKLEAANPGGSVKDRLAMSIIEAAEKDGRLKPGQTVIEATSGNTGIGLAMVCAAKGYPLVIVMAESFSIERRKLMRFLGAKVILTPKEIKAIGMVNKVRELVEKNGWFWAQQFENEANADIHERTTGTEIVRDFKDIGLDYWVTGYGTGGTVSGVSRVLRREMPNTKIILSEPANAGLLSSGVSQERHADQTAAATHPAWSPHLIQGWTPDFIPHVLQETIDHDYADEIVPADDQSSIMWSRRLATKEGIFTGISGGASFAAAIETANKAPAGSVILAMLPDTGERYLSSMLFEGIEEWMTGDEVALSQSTPVGHFPAT